jgi:para-aminobenzoate synthetase/4-amino-4-deoxychorismate lyase
MDDERARLLQGSEKDRAENLMIVDMIRNDIGRVAEIGSVTVPRLCGIERFPTVLQMTSTVTARVRSSFSDIMTALFPCASITGAPKVSTMAIIAGVESTPRGLYTGCIGYVAPEGGGLRAQFNVAIRTVTIDRDAGSAEYGVGGGILWDSEPDAEYRECEIKTRILHEGSPGFDLLEALLWTPGRGYYLLERHLARLADSAAYFDTRVDLSVVRARLDECASGLPPEDHKVRIAVSRSGTVNVTVQPLSAIARPPVQRVCFARHPVSSTNVHLYHKTSNQSALDREIALHPGCADVILWNERDEVTESCTANVVADMGGIRITPPISCGLLGGTFRGQLLDDGSITEGILTKESLRSARALWLVNSVRKWMEAVLVEE